MAAGKSGVVISKSILAVTGVVVVCLIVGSGLIGHYAFPNETTPEPVDSSTTEDPLQPVLTDFRLPTSLIPTHYKVALKPDINGDFTIEGHIEIEIDVVEPTSNITIHLADIITHNDTIQVKHQVTEEIIEVTNHAYDVSREWYVGTLANGLSQGDQIILVMNFTGLLNDQLKGFYQSSYVDADGNDVRLAATQFQATDARRAFPCFDEPGLKANFTISLARENNMTTLSNMPLVETTDIDDEWVWDHYETSVAMSTYLVAFIVSDFVMLNSTAGGVDFNVWVRPNAEDQAAYALDIGPRVQEFFEGYFSIPYALPKQDMIAIPDFDAGAMENWGLIIYRETAMLYDDVMSSASDKQWVGLVIVHELAHQWFGNLVTPKWWTDLWLNEGFATYMEYVGLCHAEPDWKMSEQFVISDLHRVMAIDSLESSHPISFDVNQPYEIDAMFDTISYSKGASLIRMMDNFLTNERFKEGLTNYLNKFAYEAAEQNDLWESLNEAGGGLVPVGLTVTDIMDTWTLQMGYPVLNVTRSDDGKTATISQSRFLLMRSENSDDSHNYMWWVPLTYTDEDAKDFTDTKPKMWMMNDILMDGLPEKAKWVMFNIQETGYYRVNYDEDNWYNIIESLEDPLHGGIHETNRAQIMDDTMALARAGLLSYEIALNATKYLSGEEAYVPWSAALTSFRYLDTMLTRTAAYGDFKRYLLDLVTSLYNSVGFEDVAGSAHLDTLKRVLAVSWACELGHMPCLTAAGSGYASWTDETTYKALSPNLKSTIFCTAIAEGGEDEWDKAWNQYLVSNVAAEKDQILGALGCSKEIWILDRFLAWTFDETSGIRKQDAYRAYRAVARNDIGNHLAWNYLKNHFDDIVEYFGTGNLGSLISYVSEEFNTPAQIQELERFQEDNRNKLGAATRPLQQAIESTGYNVAWMENNYETIKNWLEENTNPTT